MTSGCLGRPKLNTWANFIRPTRKALLPLILEWILLKPPWWKATVDGADEEIGGINSEDRWRVGCRNGRRLNKIIDLIAIIDCFKRVKGEAWYRWSWTIGRWYLHSSCKRQQTTGSFGELNIKLTCWNEKKWVLRVQIYIQGLIFLTSFLIWG